MVIKSGFLTGNRKMEIILSFREIVKLLDFLKSTEKIVIIKIRDCSSTKNLAYLEAIPSFF
jgi:hypothetical protein